MESTASLLLGQRVSVVTRNGDIVQGDVAALDALGIVLTDAVAIDMHFPDRPLNGPLFIPAANLVTVRTLSHPSWTDALGEV